MRSRSISRPATTRGRDPSPRPGQAGNAPARVGGQQIGGGLLDAPEHEPPPVGGPPRARVNHRLARVRRELPRIEAAAVAHPDAARPGPGGVEGEPGPVGRPRGRKRVGDDTARIARGDLHRPDVAALEIPAVEIGRLELPAVRRRADECEPPAVRRPGGLDVVAGAVREPALLAGREGPEEDLPVSSASATYARRVPSGDQAGHSSTPSAVVSCAILRLKPDATVPAASPAVLAPSPRLSRTSAPTIATSANAASGTPHAHGVGRLAPASCSSADASSAAVV